MVRVKCEDCGHDHECLDMDKVLGVVERVAANKKVWDEARETQQGISRTIRTLSTAEYQAYRNEIHRRKRAAQGMRVEDMTLTEYRAYIERLKVAV